MNIHREKFLDSLTSRQRMTFYSIEDLRDEIEDLRKEIISEQADCEHSWHYPSIHERTQECRVCGVDKSWHDFHARNKS